MSPLNLDNADEIIYSSQQPTGTGFILGFIAVLGLVFLYLVGLFYDGVGALFNRPPFRVVAIALGVAALSFVGILALGVSYERRSSYLVPKAAGRPLVQDRRKERGVRDQDLRWLRSRSTDAVQAG